MSGWTYGWANVFRHSLADGYILDVPPAKEQKL
jgi:hypothetical protein